MHLDIGEAIGLAIIVAVAAWHFLSDKSEWAQAPTSLFSKDVELIDGTTCKCSRDLMRRKVNGRWQYRRMTDEEMADSIAASAAP